MKNKGSGRAPPQACLPPASAGTSLRSCLFSSPTGGYVLIEKTLAGRSILNSRGNFPGPPHSDYLRVLIVQTLGSWALIHCLTINLMLSFTKEAEAEAGSLTWISSWWVSEGNPVLSASPCALLSELREPSHVGPFHSSLHIIALWAFHSLPNSHLHLASEFEPV